MNDKLKWIDKQFIQLNIWKSITVQSRGIYRKF